MTEPDAGNISCAIDFTTNNVKRSDLDNVFFSDPPTEIKFARKTGQIIFFS